MAARVRRIKIRMWGPGLLLISPSLILIAYFVYGLIGRTIRLSITDKHTAGPATKDVGLDNYTDLFGDDRFIHSLKHLGILTLVFIGGALIIGLLWALLLEKGIRGEGIFRSIYLFPMAVSMFASGVVWRWLLNSGQGESANGLNRLFEILHLRFLESLWWTNPSIWGIAAIAIPAVWQVSGYIMALFLAGFRGIPGELREAGRMDGATEFQLYRHVLFPQLSPIALSAVIILGHISLKLFDLIMATSGAVYQTEVPPVYMWQMMLAGDFAKSATIAIVLLLIVATLVIPYLVYTVRQERET